MATRAEEIQRAKALGYTDEEISAHIKKVDLEQTFSRSVLDPNQADPPSQLLRKAAQGISLNTADEIEAYLRSLTGQDKEDALRDIRLKLKNYQAASPIASTAAEIVGSLPLAVAGAPAAGATPARFKTARPSP